MIRPIVLTLCAGMAGTIPAARAADDMCRTRSSEILQALQKGDYAAATLHFDERVKAALDAQKLGQVWQQVLPQQFGAFDRAAPVQLQQQDGKPVAATPLHFAQGWLAMRVSCNADGQVSSLRFAPGPAPADAKESIRVDASGVSEQPLAVASPFGPLPGTLTLPAGDGPFPVALLVAGSGAHDRDETVGPNKPFLDVAKGLAAAGIASFRYDKRTYIYGAQIAGKAITVDDEVTDDALGALRVLGHHAHIDPRRMFVLGHSLGALMAPRIGERDSRLAGLILLAAPESFSLDTIVRQSRYIGQQKGVPTAELGRQLAPLVAARDAIARANPAKPPGGSFFHAPASYWLSLRGYNAVTVAKSLHMPMLVLQGSGDYQVTPQGDFVHWQEAFAHSQRVRLQEYPGLSHLFMPAGQPPSPADFDTPGHVDAQVIGDVVRWIKAQPAHS